MKKLIITVICILLMSSVHAQKISEAEARQYLEKVWGYLKTSDSVAFLNLWSPEDSVWQKQRSSFEVVDYGKSFNRLKNFMKPVMSENLNIDQVTVGNEEARGTEIRAVFRPRQNASMGFTFYVVNINGKLIPRGRPGYFVGNK